VLTLVSFHTNPPALGGPAQYSLKSSTLQLPKQATLQNQKW